MVYSRNWNDLTYIVVLSGTDGDAAVIELKDTISDNYATLVRQTILP